MSAYTAHTDSFAREQLPPEALWPVLDCAALPELLQRSRLNAATELLDLTIDRMGGDRTAIHFPGGSWSYDELKRRANQIARVLIDGYGLRPGNRVLLRAPNNPMLAACWFAVLKAGGIVVCTMPLLRSRELRQHRTHRCAVRG
jgi:2-aminobenzoate-CoA ligase